MIRPKQLTPLMLAVSTAFVAVGPSLARDAPSRESSKILDTLSSCRTIMDDRARLECFDRTTRDIEQARTQGDLLVMDREAVSAAKRSLFGFAIPTIGLFKNGSKDEAVELKELSSTVDGVRSHGHGMYSVTLADKSNWSFTDEMIEAPRQGEAIVIKRAALGSYKAQLKGRSAVRIKRNS